MKQLEKLETSLDQTLNKKAPKLPESSRKTLAGALWWLALAGGLLQLYLAWRLWANWHRVDEAINYVNSLAAAYGVDAKAANDLGFVFYLVLITLLVSGALLLLAAPALKEKKKSGWNFVFYSLLVNVAYGAVTMFTDYGNFGSLLSALLGSLVGAYFLFQVRDHFVKSHTTSHK